MWGMLDSEAEAGDFKLREKREFLFFYLGGQS
jgi:hypothetical protein